MYLVSHNILHFKHCLISCKQGQQNHDNPEPVNLEPLNLVSCHLCNVAKMTVIPAEAGIQKRRSSQKYWIPTFVGMTSA